ncbi:MAG: phosphoribosyltransferase [Betaproteobacteria bacterium HGW-Betaproteobacteria-11]|nr:MAG: phosphoribosyltransferase [Betaproteobacteria bacterium HGW-Betaproteobacteria-11]
MAGLKNGAVAWREALLAQDCLLCGANSGQDMLCPPCAANLPALDAPCCPCCAQPVPIAGTCGACLARPPRFDATFALWRYAFPLDQLIQSLKYAHRIASADFFGQALAALPCVAPPDLILPVPLSATRLAERGFNQSVEIARPLARRLGVPLELAHVLRCRDTTPQASLPWKERAKNVRHAFECRLDLSGKTVWLIDDVMTTGATLDELARTLKAHGAARVENRVVARAVKAD